MAPLLSFGQDFANKSSGNGVNSTKWIYYRKSFAAGNDLYRVGIGVGENASLPPQDRLHLFQTSADFTRTSVTPIGETVAGNSHGQVYTRFSTTSPNSPTNTNNFQVGLWDNVGLLRNNNGGIALQANQNTPQFTSLELGTDGAAGLLQLRNGTAAPYFSIGTTNLGGNDYVSINTADKLLLNNVAVNDALWVKNALYLGDIEGTYPARMFLGQVYPFGPGTGSFNLAIAGDGPLYVGSDVNGFFPSRPLFLGGVGNITQVNGSLGVNTQGSVAQLNNHSFVVRQGKSWFESSLTANDHVILSQLNANAPKLTNLELLQTSGTQANRDGARALTVNNDGAEKLSIFGNGDVFSQGNLTLVNVTNNADAHSIEVSNQNGQNFVVYPDGRVYLKEAWAKPTNPWPDYVFDSTYKLLPLNELAGYVAQNRHLPGVPSAEQVAKEGVPVGQMQANLLEKLEETTLYLLELQKQIDELKAQNAALLKVVGELRTR